MFTGIVQDVGVVTLVGETLTGRRLRVSSSLTPSLAPGASISMNGACLTAITVDGDSFDVEAVEETLDRTNLGDLGVGDPVDLELPMAADGRFDGHFVQGHVDGTGTVSRLVTEGEAVRMRVTAPAAITRYLVVKGSVAVDGVALTVTDVGDGWFEVVLIPHTLEVTVLARRRVADRVNVEVDVLAKYVERLLENRQ